MSVIRNITVGIFIAGVLAGIGALAEAGFPLWFIGGVLLIGGGYVGLRMVGGLFNRSGNETLYREGSPKDRPEFKVLERGKDRWGRPWLIVQGDSHDASRVAAAHDGGHWRYTHIGHYKWRVEQDN